MEDIQANLSPLFLYVLSGKSIWNKYQTRSNTMNSGLLFFPPFSRRFSLYRTTRSVCEPLLLHGLLGRPGWLSCNLQLHLQCCWFDCLRFSFAMRLRFDEFADCLGALVVGRSASLTAIAIRCLLSPLRCLLALSSFLFVVSLLLVTLAFLNR